MQLNSKGKLAKFYMWLPPDDKKLPKDLCTYFWGLVGRVLFVFGLGGVVLIGLVAVLVKVALFLWANKIPTLFMLGVGLVVVLSIWLPERKKKITIELFSETRAIIKGKIDAIKGRYCPRIEWRKPST